MIDMETIDPDWEIARKHGLAATPGILLTQQSSQSNVCPCCMNQINKGEVPLCQNSKSLEFLGYGFPLYFIFIKYALILLLILIITYTFNGIYWANQNNQQFCEDHISRGSITEQAIVCSSWMVKFSRIELTLSTDERLLRVTSFIVQLLILLYIRDILRKTNQYYDERQISPSDFSILVQNIPKVKGVAKLMKQLLADKKQFRKDYSIESFVFISKLDRYFQLKRQKRQLVHELKQILQRQAISTDGHCFFQEIKIIQKLIIDLKQQLQAEVEKEGLDIQNDTVQCQKIIMIINTEEQKEELIEDFKNLSKKTLNQIFGEKGQDIQIKQAPEPKEILWENINQSRSEQIRRVFISWAIYMLTLGTVTVCFFFLMGFKATQIEHAKSEEGHGYVIAAEVLVYSSLLLILLFNKFILSKISHKLTQYQKQKTGGDFQFSFALKHVLGLFFTTAVMTLLVEDIRFHNIYQHEYGVVEQETIMFFMNGFIAPLIWLVNPWHICTSFKRKLFEGERLMTQQEANQLMEFTHYSIGKRYSQVIEGIWFTFLYASLIPIGSVLTFIGLALFYWIDKYNLLRKSSVLEHVSSHISLQAMTLLDFTLVLRPLGEVIFDSQVKGQVSSCSIFCFILGVTYMFLPINSILDFFHPENFDLADRTYAETKENFHFNYNTLHPLKANSERKKTIVLKDKVKQQSEIDGNTPSEISEGGRHKLIKGGHEENNKCKCLQSIDYFKLQTSINQGISENGLIKGLKNLPPVKEPHRKKGDGQVTI